MDFIEENWWVFAVIIIVWELSRRGTLSSARSVVANGPTGGKLPGATGVPRRGTGY